MTSFIADTRTSRRGRLRRHCSTVCIAMVVARFMPAIALVEPVPPVAMHASPITPALGTFHLSAYLCASRELCGSAAATISLAPQDTPR
jgi:hypothetical protein